MASLGSLDKLGVLLLEDGKVTFGFPVPDAIGSEEEVHFLKGALVGLGVEGPDHGDSDDVAGAKNVICLFVEGLEHDRAKKCLEEGILVLVHIIDNVQRGTYKPAVANRPSDNTPCITLGSDFQREDLGWVQPGHSQPCRTEGEGEEVNHSNSGVTIACSRFGVPGNTSILTQVRKGSGEEHGDSLADGTPVQSDATPNAIKGEHTDESRKLV